MRNLMHMPSEEQNVSTQTLISQKCLITEDEAYFLTNDQPTGIAPILQPMNLLLWTLAGLPPLRIPYS